jgi:hypothetical protein
MDHQKSAESPGPGRWFEMAHPFGSGPAAPLLGALREHLPVGAALELVTPIGSGIRDFLRRRGRSRRPPGWFRTTRWYVDQAGSTGPLAGLAALAEAERLHRVAVWFTVISAAGVTLLEAEDGNTSLYVADVLSPAASSAIRAAVGAADAGVDGEPLSSF